MDRRTARTLRKAPTDAELKIWQSLRKRQLKGYKFRRQHPIERYIVDFICIEQDLIIEIDGGQHETQQAAYDAERTHILELKGFRVLRFWNNDVMKNLDAVLETILSALEYKPPS